MTKRDVHFTTLAIVYNCNDWIIRGNFPTGRIDKTKLPSSEAQHLYRDKIRRTWESLAEKVDVFADALSDSTLAGDDKRREIRESNLLGKPVAQECLVRAFVRLTNPPTNVAADEACRRLNNLPWEITPESISVWDRVLWSGGADGKIITKNRNLTTDLIAYMAGEKVDAIRKEELLDEYRRQLPESERASRQLPECPGD